VISSEIYPYLKSAAQVVDAAEASAAATSPALGGSTARSSPGLAAQPTGSNDVEDCIRFPLLGARQALAAAGAARPDSRSQGTQTGSSSMSRQTSTVAVGPCNPGPVLSRFALPATSRPSSSSSSGGDGPPASQPDGFLDSPPGTGLRRRGRSAAPAPVASQPGSTMLPPGGPSHDGFSSLSNGSAVREI
jgi:hypothetical protein